MTDLRTQRAWTALRKRALAPRFCSGLTTTQRDRDEFLEGARLLRFYGDRAMPGRTPHGQQLLVADMLAEGHQRNVAMLPRRSSKTTTLLAIALGRAQSREDYRVAVVTLTSGKAGRARFAKDVAPHLERLGGPDKKTWPYKVVRGAGQERVEFKESGGLVAWASSIDDLRGEAYDLIVADEASEPDPEKVVEFLAAALPTLDTRPGAQIVVAGTAGRFRVGNLLHDWLQLGHADRMGIIEYSTDEAELTDAMLATWEPTEANPSGCVRDLVLAAHPGVGTLTTADTIRGNYETLPLERFLAEYLGVFGDTGSDALLIRPRSWQQAGCSAELPTPEHYAIGLACHPDQQSAAVVVAWRDAEGVGHIMVDRHDRGVDWVAPYLQKFAGKRKAVGYDTFSAVATVEIQKLERARGKVPQLEGRNTAFIRQAAALFMDDLNGGRIQHYSQGALDAAAAVAIKRKIGMFGWGFGRALAEDDITSLEAAAIALKLYDEIPAPRRIVPIMG